MTDPMTATIAAAIAGKAVELAGEPAKEAIAAILRKVRDKFRGLPQDEAALVAVAAEPHSAERLAGFEAALRRAIADDPSFAAELQDLWSQAQVDASADHDGVVNVFHGRADKSIQLRDVHGDLTIS